jgi:hypothetical protein
MALTPSQCAREDERIRAIALSVVQIGHYPNQRKLPRHSVGRAPASP